jgi:hypothetical protein
LIGAALWLLIRIRPADCLVGVELDR